MGPNSDVDLLIIKEGADALDLMAQIDRNLHGAGAAVDAIVVTPEDVERFKDSLALVIKPALREGRVVMPPPERFPPDDPREWLNRARSNLIRAKSQLSGVYLEDLCFDAQQAAEKAIKAIMIRRNVEFPYVHDLGRLLLRLEEAGEPIPEVVRKAEELTRYALVTRYPGIARPVSEQEYAEAVEIAERVVQWAKEHL